MVDKLDSHDYSIDSEIDAYRETEIFIETVQNLQGVPEMEEVEKYEKALAEAVNRDDIDVGVADKMHRKIKERTSKSIGDLEHSFDKYKEDDLTKQPLNIFLEENVEKVTMRVSDDSNVDTKFEWKFVSGEELETKGEHYSWMDFIEVLTTKCPHFVYDEPEEMYRGGKEWKVKFMTDFLRKKSEVIEVEGSRTVALDEFKNTIVSRQANDVIDDAYSGSGIYIEGPDADEIYVLSRIVTSIADEHGETARALQAQLDSQGVIDGKVSVVKELESGQIARFWKLPRSFAEPQIPDSLIDDNGGDEDDNESTEGVSASRSGSL